jgi:Apea-like HEPN
MAIVSQRTNLSLGPMMDPEYSPQVTLFPCYFNLIQQFPGAWEICPGLKAGPILDSERAALSQFSSIPRVKESFEPNFLITVDEGRYLIGLAERLGKKVRELEEALTLKTADSHDRISINSDDLFRCTLMSLYLCYDLEIYLPSTKYNFRRDGEILIPSSSGPTHAGFHRSIYTNIRFHQNLTWPINFSIIQSFFDAIEIYYQPVNWQYDPISIALSCFWSSIYSAFPDQVYLSLSTILESLLTTGNSEVTHQVAERAAILAGAGYDERIKIYRRVKKLYNQRSSITHGNLLFKKGVINWKTSIISAKKTIISMQDLAEMAQIATIVLRGVIQNETIMNIFRGSRNNWEEAINDYFLRQLFS